jgi:GTP diphosphokinase / guanosine-3',5'-bis(diphosphate) 3'-diphosphatase
MSNIIQRAKAYAFRRHGNQCRPNSSHEPIGIHLAEVASYVADESMDDRVIAAAWLHDAVEDTAASLAEIEGNFGPFVASIVEGLTDPVDYAAMPLGQRKLRQAERVARLSDHVKIIKLADQISNMRSVIFDPPIDWSPEKAREYINGANIVGQACGDASARLAHILMHYFAYSQHLLGPATSPGDSGVTEGPPSVS